MPLQITAQDITMRHPMGMLCNTDYYYAKVGNQLLRKLSENPAKQGLSDEAMIKMALKITLYFEDIICDSGIWRSFVETHRALYGKTLPFYSINGEYYADEPHIQDIRLLLWDVMMEEHEYEIINPENPGLTAIAYEFCELLDEEFEKAPINEKLKDFFEHPDFIDDFIEMRNVLQWICSTCYLTAGRYKFRGLHETLESIAKLLYIASHDNRAVYAAMCQHPFKYKTGMLAMYPQEWLAGFLEYNGRENEAKELRAIEFRPYDLYKLDSFDETYIRLSDTLGKEVIVRKDSYGDLRDSTLMTTEGCIASFVKYLGEWNTNGMDSWGRFGKIYEEQREKKRRYKSGVPPKNYEAMMKKSGGSPLFYLRDGKAARHFLIKEVGIPENLMHSSELDDKEYIAAWMPSPDEDIFFAPDAALFIKDERNPFYKATSDAETSMELISAPDRLQNDMVRYLIANNMLPDAALNHLKGPEAGRKLAQDNLDFLARSIRRDQY